MRCLLTFDCQGLTLGGTLDAAPGTTGVLIVTGGTQTRIGSHRLFERLAAAFASAGYPCFRFDRRGVGDSEGDDPDFRGNGPDVKSAAAAFRSQCPQLQTVVGLGLCDGASSLALFGADAGLSSLLLINPWLVEAESGAPPPAAIRHHYRRQLTSREGWKKILSGSVSYRKLFKGVLRIVRPPPPGGLAGDVAEGLTRSGLGGTLILARHDATAVAAEGVWRSKLFERRLKGGWSIVYVDSDAHTFSRPGDFEALRDACLKALSGGD